MPKKLIKDSKVKKVKNKIKVVVPDGCLKMYDVKVCSKCKYFHYINKGFYPNNSLFASCSLSQFLDEIPVK